VKRFTDTGNLGNWQVKIIKVTHLCRNFDFFYIRRLIAFVGKPVQIDRIYSLGQQFNKHPSNCLVFELNLARAGGTDP
jgi:hypothetical protein